MNFAELRFWEYLLAGLGVILGLRLVWTRLRGRDGATFDKTALMALGLLLLLAVSWVTCLIYLLVLVITYLGLGWIQRFHARHALFLIVARLAGGLTLPRGVGWGLTMLAVFYAWLCFYELDTPGLLQKMKLLLTPSAYAPAVLREACRQLPGRDQIMVLALLGLAGATLLAEWLSVRRRNDPYFYLRRRPVQVVLVILTVALAPGKNNGFIYFAF